MRVWWPLSVSVLFQTYPVHLLSSLLLLLLPHCHLDHYELNKGILSKMTVPCGLFSNRVLATKNVLCKTKALTESRWLLLVFFIIIISVGPKIFNSFMTYSTHPIIFQPHHTNKHLKKADVYEEPGNFSTQVSIQFHVWIEYTQI